jgi:NAD(P)-dependent dehydrogenase (short-subunit alcohol dehydrogenase family)
LTARDSTRGANAAAEINKDLDAPRVHFVQLDVSSEDSILKCAAEVKQLLGSQKLYAVVNNAGIFTVDDPEALIRTNVYGPKRVTEAFLELLDPECGRVVHVSSGGGPRFVQGRP